MVHKKICIVASVAVSIASSTLLIAVDPTFHLKNKSANAIQVEVSQLGKTAASLRRIPQGGDLKLSLDINQPTTLELHYCPSTPENYCKLHIPKKIIATFKTGKTIYIKFDGTNILAQKGNMITGKTTEGYDKRNNVSSHDISVSQSQTNKEALGINMTYASKPYVVPPMSSKPAPPKTPAPPKQERSSLPQAPQITTTDSLLDIERKAWQQFPEAYAYKQTKDANSKEVARLVLGIPRNSSEADINKAYRKAALKYHPDRLPNLSKEVADETFKIVSNSRDLLLKGDAAQEDIFEEAPALTKKDELMALLENAPEFLTVLGHTLHTRISEQDDQESLEFVAKKIKDYPAESFGSVQARWKQEVLKLIEEILDEMQ